MLAPYLKEEKADAKQWLAEAGKPTKGLIVIKEGRVSICPQISNGESVELVSGDFFGEMALLDNRGRTAAVRARTVLEVTVMGKKVFEQISGALRPFRDFLADAVKRRSGDMWQKLPVVFEILKNQPLSTFIKPVEISLSPDDSFETAVKTLCGEELDFCCVIDSSNKLKGIMTRTDIFRAVESAATPFTKISDFMTESPIVATEADSCTIVAATMRDHNLKWVPVVDNLNNQYVKGYIRRDKMINFVLEKFHDRHESKVFS